MLLIPLVNLSPSTLSIFRSVRAGGLHLLCRTAAPFPGCVSASSSSHLGGLSPPSASCHLPLHPSGFLTGRGGRSFPGTPPPPPPPRWRGGVEREVCGSCSVEPNLRVPAKLPGSLFPGIIVVFIWGDKHLLNSSLPRRFPSHFLLHKC